VKTVSTYMEIVNTPIFKVGIIYGLEITLAFDLVFLLYLEYNIKFPYRVK